MWRSPWDIWLWSGVLMFICALQPKQWGMHGWNWVQMVMKNAKTTVMCICLVEHLKYRRVVHLNRLNNSISITTVVVVQVLNRPVLMILHEDSCDLHDSTTQEPTIISSGILPCGETNTTTIQTIAVDCVTNRLAFHHHAQTERNTNPPIIKVEN